MPEIEQPTNEAILSLLLQQTYAERMELARFLSTAVIDWISDKNDPDPDYFAALLESWEPETDDE